ncbi:TPA: hypothetical protein NGG79_002884 [Legionella pneumophila]|uniref:hypothetical protein n=1 Tax=Legionella pneumophila TaxID=446 RepID=UPI001A21FCB3|nr:hypothetical protein [Legionella pneumophila]HAT1858426.1 hypothetical protein [Legionella pneumophila]HAU1081731.1 hypothetical protein [Legionella pneumophila]HAU1116330.1 hypothetical protein [Legionella pneumophila]HBA1594547.1 hypothetical protein [Legionella pneumophila]
MILNLAKQAVNKLGMISKQKVIHAEPVNLNIAEEIDSSDSINVPDIKYYLNSEIERLDYFGIQELRVLDNFFLQLSDENSKIAAAKILIEFFSKFPEKARLISNSYYYLSLMPLSTLSYLIFITANYSMGRANWCLKAAQILAEQWSNPLTNIILARVLRECEGLDAERAVLEKAYLDNKDMVVFYNLISNLIDSNRVEEANNAIESIRGIVEKELAEEIDAVKKNQILLEQGIKNDLFAPDGDNDIYTDEMCRNYWTSYYESFVTRREHVHGDRLILNHFVDWVKYVQKDVDVVLDFGTLCAQPLYEASILAPHIQFIGTDRQKFIAEMNSEAYPMPNLSFDYGDIFEVMEKVGNLPGRKALVHIRTTCTLYPKFIEELYESARRFDFTHIYMIENAGLVRSRLKFIDFNCMQEKALVTKHRLNIHNYREQLENAGYYVNKFHRLAAPGLWRGDHPANYLGSQYEIHAISR